MEYFKNKSSLYLFVLILIPICIYYMGNKIFSLVFTAVSILFYAFSSMYSSYMVRENTLKIQTNYFSSEYIDINSILKIERRKLNIKSKYFSFDRIV